MSQRAKVDSEPKRHILRSAAIFVDSERRCRSAQASLALVLFLTSLALFLCLSIAGVWYLKSAARQETSPPVSSSPSPEEADVGRSTVESAEPTSSPLSLDYAPSDFQAVLSIRLAAISRHFEGNKKRLVEGGFATLL